MIEQMHFLKIFPNLSFLKRGISHFWEGDEGFSLLCPNSYGLTHKYQSYEYCPSSNSHWHKWWVTIVSISG